MVCVTLTQYLSLHGASQFEGPRQGGLYTALFMLILRLTHRHWRFKTTNRQDSQRCFCIGPGHVFPALQQYYITYILYRCRRMNHCRLVFAVKVRVSISNSHIPTRGSADGKYCGSELYSMAADPSQTSGQNISYRHSICEILSPRNSVVT